MLLLATYLTACVMYYILGYNDFYVEETPGDSEDLIEEHFSFNACLMFGAIVSATDPVAVVALLKELGASKTLSMLIEGESLLNDGTAMVVFLIMKDIVAGVQFTPYEIFAKFCRLSFGGVGVGVAAGLIVQWWLRRIVDDPVLEVNLTIIASYFVFYIAEFTPVHISGILALVALGFYMTRTGKTQISSTSEEHVHHVWSYLGYIAETIIFLLSGVIIGSKINSEHDIDIFWDDYLKLFGLYIFLHLIRFGCLLIFYPILSRLGYGMDLKQLVFLSYAGLRGAVGLTLALIVTQEDPDKINKYVQDKILFLTGGIAILTLIINAPTTGWFIKYLGLSGQNKFQLKLNYQFLQMMED